MHAGNLLSFGFADGGLASANIASLTNAPLHEVSVASGIHCALASREDHNGSPVCSLIAVACGTVSEDGCRGYADCQKNPYAANVILRACTNASLEEAALRVAILNEELARAVKSECSLADKKPGGLPIVDLQFDKQFPRSYGPLSSSLKKGPWLLLLAGVVEASHSHHLDLMDLAYNLQGIEKDQRKERDKGVRNRKKPTRNPYPYGSRNSQVCKKKQPHR